MNIWNALPQGHCLVSIDFFDYFLFHCIVRLNTHSGFPIGNVRSTWMFTSHRQEHIDDGPISIKDGEIVA